MMRGMIRSNRVDRSVSRCFDQGRAIFLAAKRRAHFCVRVEAHDRRVRQSQVMWGDFAGDREALSFRATNHFN